MGPGTVNKHNGSVLSYSFDRVPSRWGVALGIATVVGLLLGMWIAGFPRAVAVISMDRETAWSIDGYPPVIAVGQVQAAVAGAVAGIAIGVAAARLVPARWLVAALLAGLVVAASAAIAIVLWQWQRGRWPVGTIDGHLFIAAAALLFLVCSAASVAASASSLRQSRKRRQDS